MWSTPLRGFNDNLLERWPEKWGEFSWLDYSDNKNARLNNFRPRTRIFAGR